MEERAVNPDDLRSRAGRRAVAASVGTARRRRTIAASVGTAGLMLAVVAGGTSCSGRDDAGPGASTSPPSAAKTPDPSESTAVDDGRPLVYAAGSTIHYGDKTVDVGRIVDFVEATDDGVVYVTENDHRRLWFTDGSFHKRIGLGWPPDTSGPIPCSPPIPDRWWRGRR